jgi:hypothetical protein
MDEPSKRIEQHRNVIRVAQDVGVRKIVYTSVQGAGAGTAFSPIVQSNRQTEQDVRDSGVDWAIGRNGIYIEPDVEYIDACMNAGSSGGATNREFEQPRPFPIQQGRAGVRLRRRRAGTRQRERTGLVAQFPWLGHDR